MSIPYKANGSNIALRDHLIRCLENGEFEPFPGEINNKRKREDPNIFEIELFCNCLLPEVSDDMSDFIMKYCNLYVIKFLFYSLLAKSSVKLFI
jgi:hypothetical protein